MSIENGFIEYMGRTPDEEEIQELIDACMSTEELENN